MRKIIQCPACDKFYDHAIYHKCPYCDYEQEDAEVIDIVDTAKEKKDVVKKEEKPEKKPWFKFGQRSEPEKEELKEETTPVSPNKTEIEPAVVSHVVQDDVKINNNDIKGVTKPIYQPDLSIAQEPVIHMHSYEADSVPSTPGSSTPNNQLAQRTQGRFNPKPKEEVNHQQTNTPVPQGNLFDNIHTQGRYTPTHHEEEVIYPVVGWLVCVKGNEKGKSFNLKNGRNKIGRSVEMDVKLLNDMGVSRSLQAVIVYDSKGKEYSILPGESDLLSYLNGEAIYERKKLNQYDVIEFGDGDTNKYIFIEFDNDQYEQD